MKMVEIKMASKVKELEKLEARLQRFGGIAMNRQKIAKYIGCVSYGWEHTELEYEYRGKRYFVTKHNNGYFDKSLKQQHEEAQQDIDARIEEENKEPAKWKYEGSAQEAFDMFWDYVENAE